MLCFLIQNMDMRFSFRFVRQISAHKKTIPFTSTKATLYTKVQIFVNVNKIVFLWAEIRRTKRKETPQRGGLSFLYSLRSKNTLFEYSTPSCVQVFQRDIVLAKYSKTVEISPKYNTIFGTFILTNQPATICTLNDAYQLQKFSSRFFLMPDQLHFVIHVYV